MTQARLRGGLARGLIVYLVLALAPSPVVVSWFFARSSSALDTPGNLPELPEIVPPSLTDLAPPQPLLLPNSGEAPSDRLARLRLEPRHDPAQDDAEFVALYGSAENARDSQLAMLTKQLGDQQRAQEFLSSIEGPAPVPGTATLFAPRSNPPIPDPFVPLPARADYKRPVPQR